MPNLATLLVNSAAVHGAHVAVRHDDTTLTYEQLDEASARLTTMRSRHRHRLEIFNGAGYGGS
ncbi:hypothetical protein SRB17_59360 [Streptomyces sp. RB17]|uniref:hypothetical protein n=1 Tax=Streptomyces sp. RB17 TaxID=2585197 RepID=UPI001294A5AB|nr:hypothetical protein [Streptomyces sp. RB17]MQY37928.1 hypothetical protein [Streptomyces sp. RB17]